MPRQSILVVEDEEDILELVDYNLGKNGYKVIRANNGEDGLKLAKSQMPDGIILDLMLPGMDGHEVCKLLKADNKTRSIPVVMLTAKSEETDMVTGLDVGADDYITKPFSPRVLLARIKAVLRRKPSEMADEGEVIRIHGMVVHPGRHEVMLGNRLVPLTYTEFRVMHLLSRRPGWVFTRAQIVDGAQGPDVAVTDRSVDVHIVALRRKLGPTGSVIETVRGVGYRMRDE